MNLQRRQSGVFVFNIIPRYRPGMSNVFDYSRERFGLASLPSASQRIKQNSMFVSLEDISGECLDELDLLYVFATDGDADYACINWVAPGSFQAMRNNSPSLIQNVGFSFNGTDQYLDLGWIAADDAVDYTLNDATFFCYVNNDRVSGSDVDFGVLESVAHGRIYFNSKFTGNVHGFGINSISNDIRGSGVNGIGFFQTQRTASNSSRLLKNGSQVGTTSTTVSTSIPAVRTLTIAANRGAGVSGFAETEIGVFGIGASLSGREVNLYNAWNTYRSSL